MKVLKHAGATDASGTGITKVVSSGPELTWVSPGKTESELHERDKGTYQKGREGQTEEHVWSYTGVCYADHVLGE